jgi:hypothetical protein
LRFNFEENEKTSYEPLNFPRVKLFPIQGFNFFTELDKNIKFNVKPDPRDFI